MSPLAFLIESFGSSTISYADDTQFLVSVESEEDGGGPGFPACLEAIFTCVHESDLKSNAAKTDILLFGTLERQWWVLFSPVFFRLLPLLRRWPGIWALHLTVSFLFNLSVLQLWGYASAFCALSSSFFAFFLWRPGRRLSMA